MFPFFSVIFTALIVVIFILDTFVFVPADVKILTVDHLLNGDKSGGILKALRLSVSQIKKGQLWRLLSSTLLHVGIPHLAFNSAAVLIAGIAAESGLGTFRTLICFIFSSLFSALIMAFHFGLEDGEGASTGIYGLIAVYILLSVRSGTVFFSPLPDFLPVLLGAYAVGGMFIDRVCRREHITGFIGGLIIGAPLIFLT